MKLNKSSLILFARKALADDTAKTKALIDAIEALDAIYSQAEAQFRAGDSHATFNKQTINSIFQAKL